MRAFITGATGFLGSHLASALRRRGDEVVALVRSPAKAGELRDLACTICQGDLSDPEAIPGGVDGADAVFHAGAVYRIGIPRRERAAMYEANVTGTARVIDAATQAGVRRIVHVSTIGAFGNTHGEVVDEHHRHPGRGYATYYEETKVLAHRLAEDRIAAGAPVIIVQPGGMYGPGDTSDAATLIERIRRGRLPAKVFPGTGLNWTYIDDAVQGILLAHDAALIGETYVLGGQIGTLDDMIRAVAEATGRRPPRVTIPGWVVKAAIPFGPLVGRAMGVGTNLAESIRAADGVTYWATDAKARRELGYAPRDLSAGVREMLAAAT